MSDFDDKLKSLKSLLTVSQDITNVNTLLSNTESINSTKSIVKEEESIATKNYRYAVAHEEMNSRRRNTMEDCHRIISVLDSNHEDLKNYSYFGIYDGHGGRQIVDYLENALEETIIKELKLSDNASIEERLTR